MYQLKIGSVPIPTVYVCEPYEARKCRDLGVPYIIRPTGWDDVKIVKAFLYHQLARQFKHINWIQLFGFDRTPHLKVTVPRTVKVSSEYREGEGSNEGSESDVMEVSDDYRTTGGGPEEESHVETMWDRKGTDEWLENRQWEVDIDTLQQLHLLPVWLDDVTAAIKRNLVGLEWADGWNKKLGYNAGRYNAGSEAPNLIVLDVSGSIPVGVSYTMTALIATLRNQANADLIITGRTSQYWKCGDELPSPGKLAHLVGGRNERTQFYRILRKDILGKHWGNVIVFGDNDAPGAPRFDDEDKRRMKHVDILKDTELQGTRIDNLLAFHTYQSRVPGYGLWAEACANKANVKIDTSWVREVEKW